MPAIGEFLLGYASEAAIGFFAPKKTPIPIIKFLDHEIRQALRATAQLIANSGVENVGSTPEEFARFIKSDMGRMGEVIKSGSFND